MDPRLDPEMLAFNRMMEERAAALPPIRLELPFDRPRALTEALNAPLSAGGPALAVSEDRWLPIRGRRIQCRVHLPAGPGPHPVLLYLHGGAPVPLRGLLLNYGVFDSRLDRPSYREFATGYGLTEERMRFYWNAYAPRAADRLNPLAAPLRADLAGLPPCLLHIAELDVLADENHAMAEALRAAGIPLETQLFPGTVHGFLRALGHVGAAGRSVAATATWLKARLG